MGKGEDHFLRNEAGKKRGVIKKWDFFSPDNRDRAGKSNGVCLQESRGGERKGRERYVLGTQEKTT